MGRPRPNLGTPFGTDGPWLAAILDTLGDIVDMLDARLPAPASAAGGGPGGPVPVSEPTPDRPQPDVRPVSEPAPEHAPGGEDDKDDGGPVKVSEPSPSLPPPPPRSGKGSGIDAWEAFANMARVSYPKGASRADIIAACIAAGVIPDSE